MRMHQVIKDLCSEDGKRRKFYIAGHSLGGALATITAARVAFEDDLDIAAVYTIGSPMYADGMRCFRSLVGCCHTFVLSSLEARCQVLLGRLMLRSYVFPSRLIECVL